MPLSSIAELYGYYFIYFGSVTYFGYITYDYCSENIRRLIHINFGIDLI